jgi:protein SCO1
VTRLVARLLAAVLLSAALAACGAVASGSVRSSAHSAAPKGGEKLHGLVLDPSEAAPPLALSNYTGGAVNLASFRGKAVLVTFVYTHCTDVCPLIVSDLATAQRELGPEARHLQILAVTVDPRRDTPAAIRHFLAARNATGRMDYLIGSMPALERTWKDWDVQVTVDTKHRTNGHTAIVYGVNAAGRIVVVYPANFLPSEVVHDVPILART